MSSEALPPRRLHPAGVVLAGLKAARSLAGPSAFPALAALVNTGLSPLTLALVGLAAVLLLFGGGVWGLLWWKNAVYGVMGEGFYFKSGVLSKSERSLPLERVQSVSSVQGVVQRLFGVLEVRVETAGGGGEPDVALPALSREQAAELRRALTARGARTVAEEGGPQRVRSLPVGDLVVAGMTSGRIGVALPVIGVSYEFLSNFLPENLVEETARSLLPHALAGAFALGAAVVVAAWVLAIAGTMLAHAGFTLSRSHDGKYLYIRRGLLERREVTIPLSRVQAVRIVEGVLRQPFGLCEVKVESAGYADEEGMSTTFFPLLRRREVGRLFEEALPGFQAPFEKPHRPPGRARSRYVIRAVLPVLVAAGAVAVVFFPVGMWASVLVVFAGLYGLLRHHDAGWAMDGELLVLRDRGLGRTTAIVPVRRIQLCSLSVSPLQRRKRLATLRVRVASGSGGTGFSVSDLDARLTEGLLAQLSPSAG